MRPQAYDLYFRNSIINIKGTKKGECGKIPMNERFKKALKILSEKLRAGLIL